MATESAEPTLQSPAVNQVKRPPRNIWQLPVFVAGLTAMIVALKLFPASPRDPARAYQLDLEKLQATLSRRPIDFPALQSQVRSLSARVDLFPQHAPQSQYLIGSAFVLMAEQCPAEQAADAWQQANAAFSRCDVLKISVPLDQQKCVFRSAKAAAACGVGDPALIVPALVVVPDGEEPGEKGRWLAESFLRLSPPDYAKARDELAAYVSGANRIDAESLARMKLKLGELSVQLKDVDKARAWLKEIPEQAPAEVHALAQVQLGRLAASENNWIAAAKLFEQAESRPGVPPEQLSVIRYELARAWLALDKPASAQPLLDQVVQAGGPLALAARVRQAELSLREPTQRGNRSRAAEALVQAVADLKPGQPLPSGAVSQNELIAMFEELLETTVTEGDLTSASRAIAAYEKIASPARFHEKRAEIAMAQASQADASQSRDQAKKLYQQAADDFLAAIADQKVPGIRAEYMLKAERGLRLAGADRAARDVLEQILMLPGISQEATSSAWIEKGELLLQEKKFSEAVEAFQKVIAPGGPLATVSMVKLARANIAEAKRLRAENTNQEPKRAAESQAILERGVEILRQIAAKNYESSRDREAQQEALFELGKVYVHQYRNYAEAEIRFRQLIQMNPAGVFSEDAKLYLGTCLLLTARSENGRVPNDSERKLIEALGLFQSLSDSKKDTIQTQADLRVVRSLFLLRRFDDMPELCEKLAKKYHGRVEEVIILSMLFWCYRQADRMQQAEETFARMEKEYQALPDQAFTGLLEEYTRNYWEKVHVPALKPKK